MASTQTQLPLLSDSPIARADDPPSSKSAAAIVTRSGTRATQQHQVLAGLKRWTNVTSQELAFELGMDRYAVARRLPELRAAGLVRNSGQRLCLVSKRIALTWEVT